MPPAVAKPKLITDPGFLWGAPLGTADPTNTVTAGLFSDAVAAAWVPFGATQEGSTLANSIEVEAVTVAELFDPVKYATTGRSGTWTFSLADWTLSNYSRAANGGMAALVPSGAAGSELTTFEPPDPGEELRIMLLWESTDATVRILARQCLQGGEVSSQFQRAPGVAAIPCTFNFEVPDTGEKPYVIWGAGTDRV